MLKFVLAPWVRTVLVTACFFSWTVACEQLSHGQTQAPNDALNSSGEFEPPTAAQREAGVKRALDWLLDYCSSPPNHGFSEANARAKHQVVVFQAAHLLVLNRELFADDPRAEKLLNEAESLLSTPVEGMFSTWINGFALFYMCEKSARDNTLHPALGTVAEFWINSQNLEGGWGHSPGPPLAAFYPTTLIAASNFGLMSLGAVADFQHPLTKSLDYQDAVDEALGMYRAVQTEQGGLPYGARSYRKGPQAARTAGSLIGLTLLGQSNTDLFQTAACYAVKNSETVPFGHASPSLHLLVNSHAFAMLGQEPWDDFQRHHLSRLMKCQNEDGTFQDFSGGPDSTLTGESDTTTAYITAASAIALSADKSVWLDRISQTFKPSDALKRGQLAAAQAKKDTSDASTVSPAETWEMAEVTHASEDKLKKEKLKNDRTTVAVVCNHRQVKFVEVPGGKITAHWSLKDPLKPADDIRLIGNRLVTIEYPELSESVSTSSGGQKGKQNVIAELNLTCFDVADGTLIWRQSIPRFSKELWGKDKARFTNILADKLVSIDMATGEVLPSLKISGFANTALRADGQGGVYVTGQNSAQRISASNDEVWQSRLRGKRGTTPVSAQSGVLHAGYFLAGCTDGSIQCFDSETGKNRWQFPAGNIVEIAAIADHEDRIFFVGKSDGIVQSLRLSPNKMNHKKRVLWRTEVFGGNETRNGYESDSAVVSIMATAKHILVRDRTSDNVVILDPQNGQPLAKIDNVWQVLVTGDHAVCFHDNQQTVW